MKIIPELRFPEFIDTDNWEKKKLADVADLKNGYAFKSSSYVEPGNYGIVTIGSVQKGRLTTDSIKKIDNLPDDVQSHQILQIGDILISMTGNVGRTCKVNEQNLLLNQRVGKIIPESIFPDYLYQYTQRNQFIENLQRKAVGGAQGNISTSDIREILLPVPKNRQEQQKIASCLSSLDELIAAHNDKLDALKDHKKGLLQNLFPQEGETVPKVRFPEFEDDGDWIETTLEQVADYENGKAHEKDIDENGDYIVVNSKFISTVGETVKYSDTAFCPANLGDILMVLSDVPNGKAIAKCFYVNEENRFSVNQRICRITATDCDSRFLFYIMDRNAYFLSFDDGVKQTNLRKSDVLEFPFRIPTDPVEQTKIASCISAIDDLIKAQTLKIEELNQHKRGLMQGLFPKIER